MAFVEKALADSAWDMGNQVLYDLCRRHPGHSEPGEILAKIWLIGRSYAAAIERGRSNANKKRCHNKKRCQIYFVNAGPALARAR